MSVKTVGSGRANPLHFQRAMVFLDVTNILHRLSAERLRVTKVGSIWSLYLAGRQLLRTYAYTIEHHVARAKHIHGAQFFDGVRLVLGEGVPTGDGNFREKGVDALLVADLVYHAAVKNYDYALLVSHDTDFVHGIRRVEDFGCRTGVLGIGGNLPQRLKDAADDMFEPSFDELVKMGWAVRPV